MKKRSLNAGILLKNLVMESIIGKTIEKVEKSKLLNEGLKITFSDESILECCWNYREGYFRIK